MPLWSLRSVPRDIATPPDWPFRFHEANLTQIILHPYIFGLNTRLWTNAGDSIIYVVIRLIQAVV
jgi:hypothetical protein